MNFFKHIIILSLVVMSTSLDIRAMNNKQNIYEDLEELNFDDDLTLYGKKLTEKPVLLPPYSVPSIEDDFFTFQKNPKTSVKFGHGGPVFQEQSFQLPGMIIYRTDKIIQNYPVHLQQLNVYEQQDHDCGFHAVFNLSCFESVNKWDKQDFKKCHTLCKEIYENLNDMNEDDVYEFMCNLISDEQKQTNVTIINALNIQNLVESQGENRTYIYQMLNKIPGSANIPHKLARFAQGQAQYFLVTLNLGTEKVPCWHWLPFKFELMPNQHIKVTTANSLCNFSVIDHPVIDMICQLLLEPIDAQIKEKKSKQVEEELF